MAATRSMPLNETPHDPRVSFDEFFQAATEHPPFDYQRRLAAGDADTRSQLIHVPTGLGKTAAVVLAWLWNRVAHANEQHRQTWPRRLVYCLPMRTLVEQTCSEGEKWLKQLHEKANALGLDSQTKERLKWLCDHSPVILMGGEESDRDEPWDIYPEREGILVGTQDMLLSRALNRGYGMSRYRWPMHFGLLNNDCLWVHDETQLMGVGLETSVQLAGFRTRFGTLASCAHWWMSATLDNARLATPEAPPKPEVLELDDRERALPEIHRRFTAVKRLRPADMNITGASGPDFLALAEEIRQAHKPSTLTLVIVNTVERAQELFRAVQKNGSGAPATLLHSRFRPHEREQIVRRVLETRSDHIVVSTQVIEAGVDLSARTLFTELAPWSSLVQRFGRCHRYGELAETGADIRWIDLTTEQASPYTAGELGPARQLLQSLNEVSLATLTKVQAPAVPEPPRHIVRPKDLLELFDTTPDIAGADLDVSRFIREGEDNKDCAVFWREGEPSENSARPQRSELCPVSVRRLHEFAKKHLTSKVWTWDVVAREWVHPERIIPGREYWLDSSLGGYDLVWGFDRASKRRVLSVYKPEPASEPPEGDSDERGVSAPAESLQSHTDAVAAETERLTGALELGSELAASLRQAALWHDVGKAHHVFQNAVRAVNPDLLKPDILWAKSGTRKRMVFERPHFRHELASALAFRALAASSCERASLVAFLIAAHHGKIRLSLRALPYEQPPDRNGTETLFARGVWNDDQLLPFIFNGHSLSAVKLSLFPMQIGLSPDGQPSWLEGCLELRDSPALGPFRLALLETVLRVADQLASGRLATESTQP